MVVPMAGCLRYFPRQYCLSYSQIIGNSQWGECWNSYCYGSSINPKIELAMKTSLKIDRSSQPDVFSNLFFQYLIFFLTLSSTIGCYTELKYEENKFKRCSVREGHNHILNVSEAIEILRNTRHFGGTHRGRSCRLLDTVIAYKVVLQSKPMLTSRASWKTRTYMVSYTH